MDNTLEGKVNTTFSIDRKIKKDFKTECFINEVEMSGTLETLMVNYINISRELNKTKNGRDEEE